MTVMIETVESDMRIDFDNRVRPLQQGPSRPHGFGGLFYLSEGSNVQVTPHQVELIARRETVRDSRERPAPITFNDCARGGRVKTPTAKAHAVQHNLGQSMPHCGFPSRKCWRLRKVGAGIESCRAQSQHWAGREDQGSRAACGLIPRPPFDSVLPQCHGVEFRPRPCPIFCQLREKK